MSFLNPVRLVFSGIFQADVSTVNNDVRHFDNGSFEPSYQEFTKTLPNGDYIANGWWNPTGSGAFRLIDCKVVGLGLADGSFVDTPGADAALGMLIGGSTDRTSGKLVDIDPQWQVASAPWGLDVRLTDGKTPPFFSGRYQPNPFRDLWFTRNINAQNDSAASSTFQSVLENVDWADDAMLSPFLRQLRDATTGGMLSIRLATFGFIGDVKDPRFTLGTVVGTIGPQLEDEPVSFIRGRRFIPANNIPYSWAGITYFSGQIDEPSRTAFLDLSNALQITDAKGTPNPIGAMTLGILRDASVTENTPVTPDNYLPIARIPYDAPDWLARTAGVFAAGLTDEQLALSKTNPLALVTVSDTNPGATDLDLGYGIVAIREAQDGVYVCAEPLVHRIDGAGRAESLVYATRYGHPVPGASIAITQMGRIPGQGGGGGLDQPSAPIPDMGVPESAVTFAVNGGPATGGTIVADEDGVARLDISTTSPGNPRGYIDGQVYLIDYRIPGQSNTARSSFDYIALHVRDDFDVPADPTWDDIAPIMTQYGNLYPIMSKHLVDLGSEASCARHADILHLAFSLPETDPNYMPVTRDLSVYKRRTILAWLEKVQRGETAVQARAHQAAAPALRTGPSGTAPAKAATATPDQPTAADGKTQFAKTFARAATRSRS
ncbi:hypothetical protein J2848_006398 [Azospirillum lipoferum]|uniref:Uncharacterized protein n=1 Tax=Azospirillum lipoferum TaxID=193 RepID=A0A5A9GDI9_AZOLI|nr:MULTISPECIES: hypothetical protein [Azospirillum]KAA0591895.1 hypothetical protein FZ942_30085 [Azospirillum lipoferum]MCP1614691.1 hypothetical protein [Azospirillum lipoferum]MDW5537473.1 hypothetical protein [Azospirillum sp. NL1]